MPRAVFRTIRIILPLAIILACVALLLINLVFIPRGQHLAKYLIDSEHPKEHQLGVPSGTWIDKVMFASLSEAIFRYTGEYCDAPFYSKDRFLLPGKNMTITILMGSLQDEGYGEALRKRAMEELEIALSRCDPNAPVPELLPIHSAVIYKSTELVSLLLRHGADPSSRIHRPGKSADGLNALEFARFLAKRAKDEQSRTAYEEIATLLEQSQKQVGQSPVLPRPVVQ